MTGDIEAIADAKSRHCQICYRTEARHDTAREAHGWTHDAKWADEFDMALNQHIYAARGREEDLEVKKPATK